MAYELSVILFQKGGDVGIIDLKTLNASGFTFNKRLGQNFITDKNLLSAICSDAEIVADDCVVEVGVGAGTLTKCIAERAGKVLGFEIDRRLEPIIRRTLEGCSHVTVVYVDIMSMTVDNIESMCGKRFKVVANLPYYITTPIIMKFIEESESVDSITVMVQEEVAKRLCANAGEADYGSISAIIRYVGVPEFARKVPRQVFTPVPNVDSAVVHIKIKRRNRGEFDFYRKTVHAAFAMRRKTLVNNLSVAFNMNKTVVTAVLDDCGFNEKIRGEDVDCIGFESLAARIKQEKLQKELCLK